MRKLLVVSTLIFTFTVAIAIACGGDGNSSSRYSKSGTGADVAPTAAPAASSPAGAVQKVALKSGESGLGYFINPSEVKLKPGRIEVTMSNEGAERPHNFVVRNLSGQGDLASMDRLSPGQSNSVTFTLAQAGTYQFLCTLPGHADRGAKGTFVVAN